MAYGLQCWDENGNKVLDITSTITRLVYSRTVSSGSSGSKTLSDIDGKNTIQLCIGLSGTAFELEHTASRSGNTISWEPNSTSYAPSCDSLLLVFMYD